jgi:hypothetical protein
VPQSSLKALVVGLILGSVPGLYPSRLHLVADASLLIGVLLIALSTLRGGVTQPRRALLLIGYCNAAFWLSYVLWMLRVRAAGPSPAVGIDTFAGVLAEWFALMVICSAYELVVFVKGTISSQQRTIALLGLGLLIVQIFTSICFSYRLVQGV